jgi:CspA family cold shock protein
MVTEKERFFGKIVTVNQARRFGFIKPSLSSEDVFFHQSQLVNRKFTDLWVGLKVAYAIRETQRGPEATDVEILK